MNNGNGSNGADRFVSADPTERLRLSRPRRLPASESERRNALGLASVKTPESLSRRDTVARVRVLLPAFVAGCAAFFASGPGQALLIGIVVALLGAPMRRFPMPRHLMPATRIILALIPSVLGCGAFAVADFLGPQPFSISAGEAGIAGLVRAIAALIVEIVGPIWLRRCPIRIATLGAPGFALALGRELEETRYDEAELIGWIDQSEPDALRDIVEANGIDLVVRVSGGPRGLRSERVGGPDGLAVLLDLPVRTIGADQLYEQLFGHVPMGEMDARWYLFMMHPAFSTTRPVTDRIVELALAVPLVILLAPLMAVAGLAIKLTDRGPVFYRQTRVGEGGREFEILKLRTMTLASEKDGPRWSGADDARVTAVGRVLRRLHLDELPQLANVLRGEMTIVGPRPERPEMVAELERTFPHYRRRHLIKPGVTGWAQVRCGYAGSTLGTAWKLCHDLYYMKRRSRMTNLMIVIETLRIAGLDSHRPLRAPASQFLFGQGLGIDLSQDVADNIPPEVERESERAPAAV